MKAQFQILLFVVCLNLATGMVVELNVAGTEYVQPSNPTNASEYEGHFNATEVAGEWSASPYSGIPIIGDIFSAFQFLFKAIQYLIVGFPIFLMWLGNSFIIDASARLSYTIITGVLCAIFYILMFFYTIEFISGRYHSQ